MIQRRSPGSQSRKPSASAADTVPIRMAAARGAPPIKIALGKPGSGAMTDDPEKKSWQPEPQAERQRGRHGADQDGGGARRATDQDRAWQARQRRHDR